MGRSNHKEATHKEAIGDFWISVIKVEFITVRLKRLNSRIIVHVKYSLYLSAFGCVNRS